MHSENKKESILAKSSGITLEQHVNNVVNQGIFLCETFPFTLEKYCNLVGKNLRRRLAGACCYHDDGKKHPDWQKACRNDHDEFIKWKNRTNSDNFAAFYREMGSEAGKHLKTVGLRHEIYTLVLHQEKKFSFPVQAAIAAHHGKLTHSNAHRWEDNKFETKGINLWKIFCNISAQYENKHDFSKALFAIYEFSAVRSYLQIADHRASAIESGEELPKLKKFSYLFAHEEKNNVQRIVENNWMDDLLLVRAPTGAGKTDACLLWAKKQIENHRAERLIIAMPTRFTSNALAINVADNLSQTGLYHSSAWFSKFNKEITSGEKNYSEAKKEHELARLLFTPITVVTIDHLLISLTLTREDHHCILFNLANSCVVIDEADFYDKFTQANILVLLEALNSWKVPVLIMSASLPESAPSLYSRSGYRVTGIKEDNSDDTRIRCYVKPANVYSEVQELDFLLNTCLQKSPAIIYANTIDKAFHFYKWFKERTDEIILYHSRFTEPDKSKKEKNLIESLGRKAWQENRARGIAILTQIGELSINISADLMLSDLCPIDRLVQRAGRLSRFNKQAGDFFLLIPERNGDLYPAPYGVPSGNKWKPFPSLLKTKELLIPKGYSARDFVDLVNQVYKEFEGFPDVALHNADLLKDQTVFNWLIGPKENSKIDDTNTTHWKSRDISPNETVYACLPEFDYFRNWMHFNEYKISNGIDIPIYLYEDGRKKGLFFNHKVAIGEDEVSINVCLQGVYSSETGLIIKELSFEDFIG